MSAIPDYKELTRAVASKMQGLRQTQPDLMQTFGQLAAAGTKDGALDKKRVSLWRLAFRLPRAAMTVSAFMCRRS